MLRPSPGLRPLHTLACLLLLGSFALGLSGCPRREFSGYAVVPLAPGADLEYRLRGALIAAKPGTVIVLPEGRFEVREELNVDVSHLVLRGQGMDKTILSFANQETGAQGIHVVADQFVAQDFAVEDAAGDGIKMSGADGVTVQGVRVEWTNGPATDNGAYGLYPVGCTDVLVENSVVKGASDAGIYVGQSDRIIVRNNQVEFNVAGIEIENSTNADVYLNRVTHNTGGILVFDMPNLPKQGGKNTRVYMNYLDANNTPNFAAAGNTVALVPAGTGVLVFSNDEVEVFRNYMQDNGTMGVGIGSYKLTELFGNVINDPNYDAYPEKIHVHDNTIVGGGTNPQGVIGSVLNAAFDPTPDVALDGYVDAAKLGTDGLLPPELRICIHDNAGTSGPATFGNLGGFPPAPSTDITPHDCVHPPLAGTALAPATAPPVVVDPYSPAEIEALCNAPGAGVNWDAFVVDCNELSDYRLFPGNDPFAGSNGGIPYDLTTPLFSDYAQKYRVLFLKPGAVAPYDDTTPFAFPVGTVIAKTFTFANDLRNVAQGERWIETRLLIHRAEGWAGLAYVWADDRSDAHLALGGSAVDVTWIHTDGSTRSTNYRVPNVVQCGGCHVGPNGADPIGPSARLLNRSYDYGGGVVANQLDHWTTLGVLTGAPPSAQAPRLPVWSDPNDGTLDQRARAYLDSNCAHCHNPAGRAKFSGLWLEHDRAMGPNTGVCKAPIATGAASGGFLYDIKPGDPAQSIMTFRMNSALPAIKMPELSKSVVHDEGVALISAWIQTLPGSCQ